MAGELIDILVTHDEYGCVFRHASFDRGARFMCQVSSFMPRHMKRASEYDALAEQWPVAIAVTPDCSTRANAASAPLDPVRYIEACFLNRPQEDQPSGPSILQCVVVVKLNA
jgi:hypothetical protein